MFSSQLLNDAISFKSDYSQTLCKANYGISKLCVTMHYENSIARNVNKHIVNTGIFYLIASLFSFISRNGHFQIRYINLLILEIHVLRVNVLIQTLFFLLFTNHIFFRNTETSYYSY